MSLCQSLLLKREPEELVLFFFRYCPFPISSDCYIRSLSNECALFLKREQKEVLLFFFWVLSLGHIVV